MFQSFLNRQNQTHGFTQGLIPDMMTSQVGVVQLDLET